MGNHEGSSPSVRINSLNIDEPSRHLEYSELNLAGAWLRSKTLVAFVALFPHGHVSFNEL
ncbi:MAG: hypothetical protein AAFX40_00530 [Cyanobacteria bacterium J06639_1]